MRRCLAEGLDDLQHRHDVLLDREPAKDRGFLRQVADAEACTAVHRQARHVGAVDRYGAFIGGHQPGDHVEHGRLAGAVGAEQADGFAPRDREAHPAHDHALLVALLDVVDGEPALGVERLLADAAGKLQRGAGLRMAVVPLLRRIGIAPLVRVGLARIGLLLLEVVLLRITRVGVALIAILLIGERRLRMRLFAGAPGSER